MKGVIMKYKLSDLVDIGRLQTLMENFTEGVGTGTAILDLDGTILVATGWQDICTKFHRVHPQTVEKCTESDTAIAAQLNKGEKYNVYKCMNGLMDVAVPIIIQNEHVGNFFIGQCLFEPPDMEFFRNQAVKYGFDEASYFEALSKVPIISDDQLKKTMNFLVGLVEFIGEIGLTQKRQLEIRDERLRAEKAEGKAKLLAQEMELARRIQTSLLPSSVSNLHPDFEIAAFMLPSEQVGGDFYEITFDRSGHFWIAIGDVSGHGVTPGLIMMMAQTAQASVIANLDCDARSIVVKVNEILYMNVHERLEKNHFMTFTALKYLGDGRFQHAGAHLSMIVFRKKNRSCELIRTRGVYLNFKKDISKATRNAGFCLDPGDTLVLYTDGLTEAENPEGEMLDISRFTDIVKKHAHRKPGAMKENIMADVLRWCDNKRNDDMSLVIVKRKGGQHGEFG